MKVAVVELPDVPEGIHYLLPPGTTGDLAEHPKVAPHLAKGEMVEVVGPRHNAPHEAP